MLTLSFAVNVVVLVPVLVLMWRGGPAADAAFGPDTPARRILACVYAAIAIASATALGWPDKAVDVAHTLLPLQIAYKLMTAPAVGAKSPVAMANLAIAALHGATMVSLYTSYSG
jgi:hypothetical protein